MPSIGEIFAYLAIISIDVLFSLFFLFLSFLSTLFWFIVLNRKLPYHSSYYLYYFIYYLLLYWLVISSYLLGIYLLFNYFSIIIHAAFSNIAIPNTNQ